MPMPQPRLEIVHANNENAPPRAELAAAIARRDEADAKAADARAAADKAQSLVEATTERLNTLKAAHDHATTELRTAYAHTVAQAIREGRAVPRTPILVPVDTDALAEAESQHAAFEISAAQLSVELETAATEAAKAAQAVQAAAIVVMDHEGARLMRELIAARDIFWYLTKQASGFFLLDEQRPGGPRFAPLKAEIETAIDRHRSTIQDHPELIERHKLMQYESAQNADAARQWSDYFRRLCLDADARFDREDSAQ